MRHSRGKSLKPGATVEKIKYNQGSQGERNLKISQF